MGCNLVLPNKLVYPEFYNRSSLYDNLDEAYKNVELSMDPNNMENSIDWKTKMETYKINIDRTNMIYNSLKRWFTK